MIYNKWSKPKETLGPIFENNILIDSDTTICETIDTLPSYLVTPITRKDYYTCSVDGGFNFRIGGENTFMQMGDRVIYSNNMNPDCVYWIQYTLLPDTTIQRIIITRTINYKNPH